MNIAELIERLQSIAEEVGEDVEVNLAFQPHWPLGHSLGGVEAVDLNAPTDHELSQLDEMTHDEVVEFWTTRPEPRYVVFLAEGGQLGYLPGAARSCLGW